jgi:general stress protein 26
VSDLKQKVRAKLDEPMALWALATVTEDGKPWVRYVTPMADENMTLWCATFLQSRKVGQIGKNPEVHLTVGVKDLPTAESWLQVQGRGEVLTDEPTRHAAWMPELSGQFSGPDDPNFAVLKITPYRIEYQIMAPVPPAAFCRQPSLRRRLRPPRGGRGGVFRALRRAISSS